MTKRVIGWMIAACTAAATAAAASEQQQQQQQPQQQQQKPQQGTPAVAVQMDDLEDNPQKYLNQRITVQGEVEGVLGPRVFKIDEQNWADLDRELLVVMESPLAALVKEDDRVTITGTVRSFVDVQVDREWGWLDVRPEIEARIKTRPVLVASSIVSSDPSVPMFFTVTTVSPTQTTPSQPGTTGTTGTKGETKDMRATLTDVAQLARAADNRLVGRTVDLPSVRIERTVKEGGFWIASGGDDLFVLPSDTQARVQQGQTVSIKGHVMRMPEQMESRLEKKQKVGNEEIYVFATSIQTTK